jgi:two-component sensor histidine kinase
VQKNESRVSIEGPEVLLEPNSAQAIAVTLHELATNAAKYGALSASEGQLEVRWSHTADRRLILVWTETGGPPVKVPTRHGFGRKVIKSMIEQLKGQTRFDWRPEGPICEITLQA